jgi:hypothetical protein
MVAERPGPAPATPVTHWSIEPDEPPRLRPGSPRWWFTSRTTGRIIVAQMPNLALLLFGVAAVAARLLDGHPTTSRVLSDVASGAIIVWSLDEIVRGVNPWRRLLGVVVLTASIVSTIRR